jgi:hypothetical protein
MTAKNQGGISGVEAIKIIIQGGKLHCPVCNASIKTIPEAWKQGSPLHGIECSNEQTHFMIHCEDEDAMKEMRARMQTRSKS